MKISSIKDLHKITKKIKKFIKIGDTILLYGEIGVGKTTFTRLLINDLNTSSNKIEVLSPTFNIILEYTVNKINIRHFDLYRIKNKKDLNNIGIFENTNENITIIERPELLKIKPQNRLDIYFKYSKDMKVRYIKIFKYGNLKKNEFKF